MNVLTLRQPWANAVCYLGKRIENRSWKPPTSAVGQPLAIHAGKGWDEGGAEWIWENCGVRYIHHDMPKGCIVAVAKLDSVIVVDGLMSAAERKWFKGPIGWRLRHVNVLAEPVPCNGKQKLWTFDDVWRTATRPADTSKRGG